jgi:hypothetical protein
MDMDADMDADVDFVSGEDGDGDDGGVCVVLGVKLALDETEESDRSDNCGELVAQVPLYLKYAFWVLGVAMAMAVVVVAPAPAPAPDCITERYGFTASSY